MQPTSKATLTLTLVSVVSIMMLVVDIWWNVVTVWAYIPNASIVWWKESGECISLHSRRIDSSPIPGSTQIYSSYLTIQISCCDYALVLHSSCWAKATPWSALSISTLPSCLTAQCMLFMDLACRQLWTSYPRPWVTSVVLVLMV